MLTKDYGFQVNRIPSRIPQENSIAVSVHQTKQHLVQLVFGRDVMLNIKYKKVGQPFEIGSKRE